jgi:hypothetical protein
MFAASLLVPFALTGCGGGPSTGEFVAACLESSTFQEVTEDMCECAADVARSSFPDHVYTAMVYDMQGRKQEAAALTEKMTTEEQMGMMEGSAKIIGQCFVGQELASD